MSQRTQKATFAAGCFWGVEEAFRRVQGVLGTRVGYTGGSLARPSYQDVCSGRTGHAEAVEVTFDPEVVSFERLLQFFWDIHDPTTLNRQGPDIGSQYRSAIFFHDAEQQEQALVSKGQLEGKNPGGRPVVTQVVPAAEFWPAEEYHQQYYAKRGGGGCR
ncbi:peptide-methionine (S)-S-oxide reductase [Desulfuromonas versatilis]|uniref:Peptide methionine sulfoxide reductase MsrA n=1 Tax=Desulfuromonas versatilis TaxID=2802975 RepID=A0ABM8HT00_9BACT|nr:peptide-methionine (S)-S-oxide reductase MsrA [Desulfuromonas versatilis]BCR05032.1 peptide-methionine (S)-S-oxide reductase [Desulfuromonas versatilis]